MKTPVFSFSKIKKFFNKKITFILLIILLFIVFFISSLHGSLWRVWPQIIRSSIAINRLAISVYENPICRDVCFYQQLAYEQEIIKSLNNERVYKRLKKTIFNQEDNLRWRLESIKIIEKSLDENLYLADFFEDVQLYIDDENIAEDLDLKQSLISSFFSYLEPDNYIDFLKNSILKHNLSKEDEVKSIKFLSFLNINLGDYYFDLLTGEDDQKIITTILESLGGDIGRLNLVQEDLFPILKDIFSNTDISFENRRLIIFILSDFLAEGSGQEALIVLEGFYQNENTDKFSKFLITDILNRDLDKNYVLPDIKEGEWDNYYL